MHKVIIIIVLAVAVTGYAVYELAGLRALYVSNSDYIQETTISAAEKIFAKDGAIDLTKTKELIALASEQSLALVPIDILIKLVILNVVLLFSALLYFELKSAKSLNKSKHVEL